MLVMTTKEAKHIARDSDSAAGVQESYVTEIERSFSGGSCATIQAIGLSQCSVETNQHELLCHPDSWIMELTIPSHLIKLALSRSTAHKPRAIDVR